MAKDPICPLFAGMSNKERETLLRQSPPPVEYQKGACIYDPAKFDRAVGLIEEGRVTVTRAAAVLNRLGPGDLFGVAALYSQEPEYATRVVARTPCRIRFFPQPLLEGWMRADFRVAENYIRFLSDRIRFLNRRIAAFTAGSVDQRLLTYLQQQADGSGLVPARSMTELARILDMSRTSLYRSLDELAAAGYLRREGKLLYYHHPEGEDRNDP